MAGEHRIAERFDFALDRNTAVFTCKRVMGGAPITQVFRDDDDSWQFLCAADHDEATVEANGDDIALVCLECTVAGDPTLNDVADLKCGEAAAREVLGGPWTRDDGKESFAAKVAEHGWMVMGVTDEPPFSYTVGLWSTFGHPELIVIGLATETAHAILNDCGERIRNGESFLGGNAELGDLRWRLHDVEARESKVEHIGYALWFYDKLVPLRQLVWPSRDGAFPDEPSANEEYRALQPLLP